MSQARDNSPDQPRDRSLPPASIPFAQYRRALAFVAPYWRGFALVTFLGLLSTAISLAQPYISRLLIDDALLRHDLTALAKIALLMLVVTVAGFAVNIASGYRYVRLSAECLEQAAELPRGGEMRIERKRPFDQVSAFLRFEHYPRESVPGP